MDCVYKKIGGLKCRKPAQNNKIFCSKHGKDVENSDYHKICAKAKQFDCTNLMSI